MNLEELIKKSNLQIDKEKIVFNEPMNKHSTFKIGGPAECFIKIDNINDLKEILQFSKKNEIPLTVIGNGSNILVSDKGIKRYYLNDEYKKNRNTIQQRESKS